MLSTIIAKVAKFSPKLRKQGLTPQLLYLMHSQNDDSLAEGEYQWLITRSKTSSEFPSEGQGNLVQALHALDKKRPITLILPSHRGVLTQVDIPSRRNKQIRNALPFLMQTRLLQDASQFYFSWLSTHGRTLLSKGNALTVAGYPQTELLNLINKCKVQGLKIKQIILDAQLLPTDEPTKWTLLADGQYWLLNYGNEQCCSIEHAKFFDVVVAQALETFTSTTHVLKQTSSLSADQENIIPQEHASVVIKDNANIHEPLPSQNANLSDNDDQEFEQECFTEAYTNARPQINVFGQSARQAMIKLQEQGWPASSIHIEQSNLHQSRVMLLHEYGMHQSISLLPREKFNKSKQTINIIRNFCLGSGRAVMLWGSYCILTLMVVLTLYNQQLEHDVSLAKDTYTKIASPLKVQLDRLAVPQTLEQRVDSLRKLRPSGSRAFTLLDIWGNIRGHLRTLPNYNVWAVNRMNYTNNNLQVMWQVTSVEQAMAEGKAIEMATWTDADKVNLTWRYVDADTPSEKRMILNLNLLENVL